MFKNRKNILCNYITDQIAELNCINKEICVDFLCKYFGKYLEFDTF